MSGILEIFKNFRWLFDLLDIGLVAFIIYRIILLIKGTRAVQMLLGLAVLLIVYMGSQVGGLYTLHWILDNFLSSIILVIVVLFQNDIRRALIHVGRNPFFADLSFREESEVIDELVKSCVNMANKKIGALIVIERETGLKDFLEVGVEIRLGGIRIGQVGTSHAHAAAKMEALRSLPDLYEVVGIAEPIPGREAIAKNQKAYRGSKWLTEKALLSDPSVQAVAIETTLADSPRAALASLRAGKHIHLDKPGAASLRPAGGRTP